MVFSTRSVLHAAAVALMVTSTASAQSLRNGGQQQQQQRPRPTPTPIDCTPAPANWYIAAEAPDYNNKAIADLLSTIPSVRKKGEAYAVFDWDNTCTYGDISYTSVFFQMDHLEYRVPADKFEEVFTLGYNEQNGDECLPQGINTVLGKDVNDQNVTLREILRETAQDYKQLHEAYIGPKINGQAGAPLETIKQSDAFKNFRAKLAFLVFGLEASYGHKEMLWCAQVIGMTVFTKLLYGMTEDEMRTLIRSSLRWNFAAKLDTPEFVSTGSLAVKGAYMTGLRAFNGQETVMRALRANGADVYIISASPQVFVEEVGNFVGLGYWVPKTNVYGIRQAYDQNGKFTAELIDNYPITWGPGKAQIVESFLKPKYNNKAPVFASGDSNGDCQMMDTVRDGVVHVNNRLKDSSNCIQTFYEKSCQYFDAREPATNNRYLLQGQDKEIGSWIPSGFTTKDGKKFASGVTSNNSCAAYKFMQV